MSPEWITVLLIGGLLILLALGVEIAVGMGIIASVGLLCSSINLSSRLPGRRGNP